MRPREVLAGDEESVTTTQVESGHQAIVTGRRNPRGWRSATLRSVPPSGGTRRSSWWRWDSCRRNAIARPSGAHIGL